MPYLKTQSGINWYYKTKGSKVAFLLLHGWSFDSQIWVKQFDGFCSNYNVISLDLPGHGRTDYKKDIDIIADLYQITQRLKLDKLNLMGHSFGGLLALRFAYLYPELTRRLVLVSTSAKFVKSDDYKQGLDKKEVIKLREFLAKDYPNILSVFMRWLFSKEERNAENFREIQDALIKREILPKKEALEELLSFIENEDLREELKKINVATLIISGTDDPICPAVSAEYLLDKIKGSKMKLFENCGHLPFLTQPQRFNTLVEEFLVSE